MIDVELTRAITIAGYAIVAATAVIVDVVGRRRKGEIAPLGQTVAAAMGDRTIRLAVVLTWWWLGWHFLGDPFRTFGV